MACERHDSIETDITRLRDDDADLYEKHRNHESRIVILEAGAIQKQGEIDRIENQTEKQLSKLEGMIQALSAQLSAIQHAGAAKLETRWNDIVKSVLSWGAVAALGALAMKFLGGGGMP